MDSYSCAHPDEKLIEDRLCGNVVCTGCGVVVESYVFDECAPFDPPAPSRPHKKPVVRCVRPEVDDLPPAIASKLPESVRIIKQICASLRLNESVQDIACEIHKEAIIKKALTGGFRGKSFKSSAVSAVYFACKLSNVARAEVEMHANYDITKTELSTMNKLVRQLLRASKYSEAMNAPLDPKQLLPRFIAAMSTHPAVIPPERTRAVRAVADTALPSKAPARTRTGQHNRMRRPRAGRPTPCKT